MAGKKDSLEQKRRDEVKVWRKLDEGQRRQFARLPQKAKDDMVAFSRSRLALPDRVFQRHVGTHLGALGVDNKVGTEPFKTRKQIQEQKLDWKNYDSELDGYYDYELGNKFPATGVKGRKAGGRTGGRGTVSTSNTSGQTTSSTGRSSGPNPTAAPSRRSTGKGLKNTPAPAQQKAATHTIRKGETLGTIAKRYGVDWRALAEANNINDPNLIYAGVKLRIDPATMGKKNRRKVSISRPKVTPPGMRTGEKNFPTPTRGDALAPSMNTGALSIEVPEEY